MNPEEGELRPQLLDRFGLCVDVEGIRDPDERVLIAERDAAFKRRDHEFSNEFAAADHNLSRALGEAIAAVKNVRISAGQARLISSICVEADVLGHRADVVIDHAARALAAYRRHISPSREDIYDAATLALAHRARQPISRDHEETSSPQSGEEQEGSKPTDSQAGEPQPAESDAAAETAAEESSSTSDGGEHSAGSDRGMTTGGSSGHESAPDATETFNLRRIDLPRQRRVRKQGGKRSASQTPDRRGRYVRAEPKAKVNDLAIDATVRAAAPMQVERGRKYGERLKLERDDLRQKVRERKVGNLIVFVVDASASMDAEQRMAATKGAILSLLQDAYMRRDRVAVVIFKNRTAEVVLRPTSSVSLAPRRRRTWRGAGDDGANAGGRAADQRVRVPRCGDDRPRGCSERGIAALRARCAGRGQPQHPLRRRGQPPRRPHRRCAPRRGSNGCEYRRARRCLRVAPVPVHPGRDHEPGGGRAAAAAA